METRNYFRFGMRVMSAIGLALIVSALSFYNLEWLLSKLNVFSINTQLPFEVKMIVSGGLFMVSSAWFFRNLRFLEAKLNEKLGIPERPVKTPKQKDNVI